MGVVMKIVISAGDINGIGLEIFYKAMLHKKWEGVEFTLVVSANTLKNYFDLMEFEYDFDLIQIIIGDNTIDIDPVFEASQIDFGKVTIESGRHAVASLEKATGLLQSGFANAIVTLPISKEACQITNWNYPGHTEYFAEKFNSDYMMVLTNLRLYVALATIHIPISKVTEKITKELLIEKVQMLDKTLRVDIGIAKPKIAVLGLNPHAGENGHIGNEENIIINPAIAELKANGYEVEGAYAADGFFAAKQYHAFDGVLAMYHDQGLIPLKMLAFPGGVNFTAGLPVIRTSPDHGTAFAIAGQDVASAKSLIDSIELAEKIYSNRKK